MRVHIKKNVCLFPQIKFLPQLMLFSGNLRGQLPPPEGGQYLDVWLYVCIFLAFFILLSLGLVVFNLTKISPWALQEIYKATRFKLLTEGLLGKDDSRFVNIAVISSRSNWNIKVKVMWELRSEHINSTPTISTSPSFVTLKEVKYTVIATL